MRESSSQVGECEMIRLHSREACLMNPDRSEGSPKSKRRKRIWSFWWKPPLKWVKSDLVNCLEELMQSVENRTNHMMSQSLTEASDCKHVEAKGMAKIFGQYSESIFCQYLKSELSRACRVDVVWDIFGDLNSLKSQARGYREDTKKDPDNRVDTEAVVLAVSTVSELGGGLELWVAFRTGKDFVGSIAAHEIVNLFAQRDAMQNYLCSISTDGLRYGRPIFNTLGNALLGKSGSHQ
ncbi:hypothetical protein RRG08_035274 [Elysia crispata]|uniref:Uncharacterized protein n=1 Tax=Elysia crispata TaxID=231223 RepID=A0AAE1DN51_9GAST|nr:hypothetical protein RRG08_035274 [Elysia crispata]